MKIGLGLVALLMLAGNVQAEEYYRSIDGTGKVHYGDAPVTDAADFEKLKPLSEPVQSDSLPFELKRAKEKFPVTLYVAENCGEVCAQARDLLTKRGVPFTEINLVTVDEIEDFKKTSGSAHIPTMGIGSRWVEGFLQKQWSKELDSAGYPKTASYGVHRILKAPPVAEKKE